MGTRGSGVGAEVPSPPPDSEGDYTPDRDHVGFIDPLGVLKGSNKKSNLRSQSSGNCAKEIDRDVCDYKERSETEGKASSGNVSSQDFKNQKENAKNEVQNVEIKQEMLPDPLNATLIPSTATKPAPKRGPRKAAKMNEKRKWL